MALVADGRSSPSTTALRTVGYELRRAGASRPTAPRSSAAVNDPAFTVAGDRLAAYQQPGLQPLSAAGTKLVSYVPRT